MNCEQAREAMDAEFAGEAAAELSVALRAHLPTCASCRERYERLARVDAQLSGGGLSEQKQDALLASILARSAPAVAPVVPGASPRAWGRVVVAAGVLASVVALLVAVSFTQKDDPFTPRGGSDKSWGVRAFCVEEGRVTAEARAGETLSCGKSGVVQFTYTAPSPAKLSIALDESSETFISDAPVNTGTDVALPTSTPVGEWLSGPRRVTARFTDGAGGTVAESALSITPR